MLTRIKLSMAFGFLKVQLLFWGLKFFKSTPMEKFFLCYGRLNYGLKQSNVASFPSPHKGDMRFQHPVEDGKHQSVKE